MIEVLEVKTRSQKRDFYNFPIKLYKDNKYNVPALVSDEKDEFDPNKNGAFEYAIARQFVAYKGGKCVGRIAGIISKAYNEKHNVKQIRFTRFDVIDDIEVTKALFAKIFEWAKECGMNQVIGPIGFSDLDKQGMLVEGFEEMDLYVTIYNFPYYVKHMEAMGFTKDADWLEFEIKIPEKMDPTLVALTDRLLERHSFKMLEIKDFESVKPMFKEALSDIMNTVYSHLYGVVSINEKQIEREANALKQIFIPDLALVVMSGDKIAGYGFMAPNISAALKKANGHILPFGLIPMIKSLKKFDKVDFYSIGVRPEFQGKGVNALIMRFGHESLIKHGVKHVYTGPELESNSQIQSMWKNYEKRQTRRRRSWKIDIV